MYLGIVLIFKPLVVLADVLPFLGDLAGMGTGLIAFLLATPGTLVVVALAWIYYRPLLGLLPLVGAAALLVVFFRKFKRHKLASS
jgi:hypothetical protein